ncbi:MAG: PfkB family carbohydrate kinase [Deltaproteobacteria bacterium]|nr:PfkB family carbohydrate kinase [Deltaproteobacteria bacterium]
MSPSLVVLGHVTLDLIRRAADTAVIRCLGGAASFCARVAERQGETVGVVTAAPADLDVLVALKNQANIGVALHPCAQATTFSLDYSVTPRALRLLARADDLQPSMLPAAWTSTKAAFIGPVANECAPGLVQALPNAFVGVGMQGVMRVVADDGAVRPTWPHAWLAAWPASAKVAVLSDEDHPHAAVVAQAVATKGAVVALTHGSRGSTLFVPSTNGTCSTHHVPACLAVEVDPTGAGDTFAVMLTLGLAAGKPVLAAAQSAAEAAARVVEGPGLGRL